MLTVLDWLRRLGVGFGRFHVGSATMLDRSSQLSKEVRPREASDLLTRVLLELRLDGVAYGRFVMREPWAIAFPAQRDARFVFVARGDAWLWTPADQWQHLQPGDAVLLPRGDAHVMASSSDVRPVDVEDLSQEVVAGNVYLVRSASPTDAVTDTEATSVLFCGAMHFNLDPLHPLLVMLPNLMHAGELVRRDPAVLPLLEAMEREVALDRIGACGILARLADVLAASIIRAWVECRRDDSTGWTAALQCPKLGKVIAAIHAEPERHWDVSALAQLMGASRSRFSEAFTRVVGESPARYVVKVKMFQARQWIQRENIRVAVAAERLGYESEASFSRAFKRIIGVSPSAARSE